MLFRLVLSLFLCSCTAVLAGVSTEFCNENSTITSPQMSANVDILLNELTTNTAQNGFSIATYGKGNDTVYGLGQCRRDLNITDCPTCINAAAMAIRSGCGTSIPLNSTDQRRWEEECFLRYYDKKFFGTVDTSVVIPLSNIAKPKNPTFFSKQVTILMNNLTSQAVFQANKGLQGKGNVAISSSVTVYGLVQCTEDLSPSSCSSCLKTAIGNLPKYCKKTVGCRIDGLSD